MESVDIPVELTVKSDRWLAIVLAIVASAIGAGLAAYNSKPADATAAQIGQKPVKHALLGALPLVSGFAAGLLAAFVLYADDATWGSTLGADIAKLVGVVLAATGTGLVATAAPAKAARERITE